MFGTITKTSIQVRCTNTPSNLSAGNSGLIVRCVTTGSDSGWKQDNDFWTLTDLAPNTRCTFTVQTRNGDGVTTPATSATPVNTLNSRYTLPVDPMVTCDRATGNPVYPSNTVFTFTNQAGWGQGNLKRYDYGWTSDPGPTYNSSSWSSGALAKTATPLASST